MEATVGVAANLSGSCPVVECCLYWARMGRRMIMVLMEKSPIIPRMHFHPAGDTAFWFQGSHLLRKDFLPYH